MGVLHDVAEPYHFLMPNASKRNCYIGVIIASHSFCVRLKARRGYISVL